MYEDVCGHGCMPLLVKRTSEKHYSYVQSILYCSTNCTHWVWWRGRIYDLRLRPLALHHITMHTDTITPGYMYVVDTLTVTRPDAAC